jgi:hypothetical protein
VTVAIALVTVTASYLTPDGDAAVGTVTFTPSITPATEGALVPAPLAVTLVDGALSVDLLATDDAGWAAPGWTYRVAERIRGARPRSYNIEVPAGSPTLDLALVAPVVDPAAVTAYLLTSQLGAALGVASLDADGQVPLSQLGHAPSGGGGSGTPSNTVTAETSYGISSSAGAATTYSRGDHTHGTPALGTSGSTAAAGNHNHSGTYDPAGTAVVAVAAHEADTTNVHGIADTAALATTAAVAAGYQPLDADLTTIAGLTPTTDNVIQSVGSAWASRTPAQLKSTLALAKADVGLGSVDNTSDAGKPVSTAQQTALNLKADLASPTFTGTPAAPTAGAGTSTTQLATTAFVTTADNLKAPLASPTFTGTPSLPTGTTGVTQSAGNSTTALATTAFVTTADNLKANLASPTFTGTPAAPTAAQGTNTTQLATTAYVQTEAGLLVPKSLVDAKGDLLVGSAADTVARLAVGSDGQVLTADAASTNGVKWAAAGGGSGTDFKVGHSPWSGKWSRGNYGPVGSNLTLVLNRLYAAPYRLNASGTADRIGVDVATAAAAGGVARLVIYQPDGTGGMPGTVVLDAGTVAIDTTGAKAITISQALSAGFYWLAVIGQTATGAAIRGTVSYDPMVPYFTGANMFTGSTAPGGISSTGTSYTGAPGATPTIADNDNCPIIGLRFA